MYSPQVFTSFGDGLNLRSKADAVGPGEAIDLMNVIFTDRGAVQQRDGYAALTSSALTNAVGSLEPYYTTAGTKQLLAGCGTRLEALSTAGAVVASATGKTAGGIFDFCRFGTPSSEVAYAGNGLDILSKWNGTAWSTVANSPKAGALCVTPTSNRMVGTRFLTTSGGPSAGTSSPSHVYFSNAGDPETWSTNDYVQLTPGDGEQIQACIAWREYVFVFKETKFFIFTAESVSNTGTAIFNYRIVDTGVGLVAPRGVVATQNGVYFASRNGVYITTGAEPVKLSDPIDPIFLGGSEQYFTGGELDASLITSLAMGTWRDLIFLAYSSTGTSNNRALVFDTNDGWWSLWDLPASSFATFRVANNEDLVFGYASGSNRVGQHNDAQTSDAGTAISSHWRGGFQDLTLPENKKIRQQKVWGSGVVSCGVSADYATGTGSLAVLSFIDQTATTWGGSTWGGGTWAAPAALNIDHRRNAIRGTVFSTYFANATLDQVWSVHRLEHHITTPRQPTIKKTELA